MTSAESTALTGAGALEWAGGSQMWSGTSADFAIIAPSMHAAPSQTAGTGAIRWLSMAMSSVPYWP